MKIIPYTYNPFQKPIEAILILLGGGVLYYGIEVLWRGYSHWSMALCGAICFYVLYRLNAAYPRLSLPFRALLGACFITGVELFVGCLLNLGMGLSVWDYSQMPLNFLGQICLPYSIVWFLLCFPIAGISYLIRRHVFYAHA